ncbi:MAG: hypothetical protein RR636_01875 [Clostridium sp.]|uniref:hypothetical protein n=1 Tax=Clostridium sp. TaxID=1506 RepID=UPI00302AF6E4
MSGIWKINMMQNYTTRDDFNKLSFKKGDSFSARVLRLEGSATDIVIKLLDGRVFPARVEGMTLQEPLSDYMFKFQLEGFENGKFLLNVLESNVINKGVGSEILSGEDPLMEELLKNLDFPVDKSDVQILKTMLKNNIPLTQENLLDIKGLKEFTDKGNNSVEKIDVFIDKFIEGKGILPGSQESESIKSTLTKVLNQVKNLNVDDVFIMKSLNVKLNEDSIKSFTRVVSNDYNILEQLKDTSNIIKGNSNENTNNKFIIQDNIVSKEIIDNLNTSKIPSQETSINPTIDLKENVSLAYKESTLGSIEGDEVEISINEKEIIGKLINEVGKEKVNILKDNSSGGILEREITSNIVKEELKDKISLIKSNLLEIMKLSEKGTTSLNNITQSLEAKFQDFKMLNTINNNYYMLNVPINTKNNEYGCKLIIKDDRGKGKKLDSENIKIAASVATVNMDKVDAYVTVNKNVASIQIESEAIYVKLLEKFKGKLLEDLSTNSYMFNVAIKERKHEFSFSNCRSFFEDEDFRTINTRV